MIRDDVEGEAIETHDVPQIVDTLERRYGLDGARLERLPIGQGAINYRSVGRDFTVFVKRYPPGADLEGERNGMRLSELAGRAGVPVAPIIPNVDGEWIDQSTDVPISVWVWVSGLVRTNGLHGDQYAAIGQMLGNVHRTFSDLPGSRLPADRTERWRCISVPALSDTIDRLRMVIRTRLDQATGDDFDHAAIYELTERRSQIARIPHLLESLPPLASQVLHGDYSLVNMLFDGSNISAVLDFRPPDPFLVAHELGRVAFTPDIVVGEPNWLGAAFEVVRHYLQENRRIGHNDIRYCGRVATLQPLKSLYGVREHYLGPGLIQTDLDRFWRQRHKAVSILLNRMDEVDEMLQSAVR